jgi:hypothetical protein
VARKDRKGVAHIPRNHLCPYIRGPESSELKVGLHLVVEVVSRTKDSGSKRMPKFMHGSRLELCIRPSQTQVVECQAQSIISKKRSLAAHTPKLLAGRGAVVEDSRTCSQKSVLGNGSSKRIELPLMHEECQTNAVPVLSYVWSFAYVDESD